MELRDRAEDHAGDLLRPLGRRWRHAQAVAETAQELAIGMTPEDADVLVASAYLHDIGYAPGLAMNGFHPLDGARHLRAFGHEVLPDWLLITPERDTRHGFEVWSQHSRSSLTSRASCRRRWRIAT